MPQLANAIVAVLTTAFLAGSVQAVVIDFGGLPGSNGDAFVNPYQEDGYFVLPQVAGDVFIGKAFGNPTPSLVVGSVFGGAPDGSVAVVKADGTNFKLTSFDFTSFGGRGGYSVTGFAPGGAELYVFSGGGNFSAAWQTIPGKNAVVSLVLFEFVASGSSVNLDNINVSNNVSVVPEPATWALMIAGFGIVGGAMRRRTALAA